MSRSLNRIRYKLTAGAVTLIMLLGAAKPAMLAWSADTQMETAIEEHGQTDTANPAGAAVLGAARTLDESRFFLSCTLLVLSIFSMGAIGISWNDEWETD